MRVSAFGDGCQAPVVVAIGVFDGLHLGHMRIVEQTISLARSLVSQSMVMTFSQNPKMACGRIESLPALISDRDFAEMLISRGIAQRCVIDFSDDMSKLTGEEFIARLCTSYDVRAMVVGDSFRAGNSSNSVGPAEIEKLLSRYTSSAFLSVVPSVIIDNQVVSSSLIRRCLLTGDLAKVAKLLGRAYSLDLKGTSYSDCFDSKCYGSGGLVDSSQIRLFDVRTLGLLLPKRGSYMVEATDSGLALSVKASAVISEACLALNLPVRMNPDRITFLGE